METSQRLDTPGASPRIAGFTLIEMSIAAVMLLLLTSLVASLSVTGMNAQKYTERMSRVTEITQDLVDQMRRRLRSSVRVFTNDAIGNAYLALVDRAPFPPPLASERLPALDSTGIIEPDTQLTQKTGNSLFFARYAWTDEFRVSSSAVHRVDVYRFEYSYLSRAGQGPEPDSPDGLNLVHWVSEPVVDGAQVDRINDLTEQSEVLMHLYSRSPDMHGNVHDQVEVAWRLGADPLIDGTLRQIDSTGQLLDSPPPDRGSEWTILPQTLRCDAGVLHYRHHSVATNFAPPVMGVGAFGWRDDLDDGFPHGFEIQIVGPASARQVLVHLTLVSTNNEGHRAFHDMQVLADVRDL